MTETKGALLAEAVIPGLPQSVNRIWRNGGNGRTYKTKAAKEWQETAAWYLRQGCKGDKTYDKSVKVDIKFRVKNKRSADLDNLAKQAADAIQSARVINNDNQVVELWLKKETGCGRDETIITVKTC